MGHWRRILVLFLCPILTIPGGQLEAQLFPGRGAGTSRIGVSGSILETGIPPDPVSTGRGLARPPPFLSVLPEPLLDAGQSMEELTAPPGRAFLLSALVPGLGQRAMGQNRWVAYLAGEVWAWVQYLDRRREGRRLQDRYRDLAWLVARRVSTGTRLDGDFEYYESMTQFQSSGAYDLNPGQPGVQPEQDPDTYNGYIWGLARDIFSLDDPDAPPSVHEERFERALRYYLSRAYAPVFAWNWSTNTLQQAEFGELIRLSDENLRRGTAMIGVILANHLLSSVDALVTGRLRQETTEEPRVQLSLLPGPLRRDALVLSVRIPTR